MILPLPENEIDIYSFGFDKNLLRSAPVSTPLVYNQVEERLSQIAPSNTTIATLISGLPVAENQNV